MILLIDNYDSFSYNLYQYVGEIDPDIRVIRNDEMTVEEILELNPERMILSPGPGRPEDAGMIIEAVQKLGDKIPILGVCLGHQAICAAFGAEIVDKSCPIFKGCPDKIKVARYHSLAARADSVPDCLRVTAKTDDGEIMAVEHAKYPIFGVQFHPESILTPQGKTILKNFLRKEDKHD